MRIISFYTIMPYIVGGILILAANVGVGSINQYIPFNNGNNERQHAPSPTPYNGWCNIRPESCTPPQFRFYYV